MNKNIEQTLVKADSNVRSAMEKINDNGFGLVFVSSKNKVLGSLTDGDIRRHLLEGGDLDSSVMNVMNLEPIILSSKNYREHISRIKPQFGNILVPLVDDNQEITDIVSYFEDGRIVSFNENPGDFNDTKLVKTVGIMGGAGYLGSVLSKMLLSKGYQVYVLDNLLYGSQGIESFSDDENFTHVNGSMENVSEIIEAIKEVDAVVHLGAIVGDPASALDPSKTLSINLHCTKLVADICKFYNIKKYIFASTCSVYGKNEGSTGITEEAPMNPVSLYARTKIDSENILLSMVDSNFSPTILRFSTLFGLSERMRFDLVVNILCAKAFFEKEITIFGGQQFRPLLSTIDASRAIIKCLESNLKHVHGEIFNVGNTALNYRILEIGEVINRRLPDSKMIITSSDEDTRDYNVSFDKIQKKLNFSTEISLEDGIDQIVEQFESGKFKDYMNKKYSNYNYLRKE